MTKANCNMRTKYSRLPERCSCSSTTVPSSSVSEAYDFFLVICWHAPSEHLRMVPRAKHRGTDTRAFSSGTHRAGISDGNDTHDVSDVPRTYLAPDPLLVCGVCGRPSSPRFDCSRSACSTSATMEECTPSHPARIGPAPTLGAHTRSDPRSMGSREACGRARPAD